MSLAPEVSLPTSLATAALVWAVYNSAMPTLADVRSAPQNDEVVNSSERTAAWTATGVVAAVSLISHDLNPFILGSGMIIALSWWHRHANAVNPDTNKASTVSPVRTPDMYTAGSAS